MKYTQMHARGWSDMHDRLSSHLISFNNDI